ncbi:TM237-like protein, partial [Mya arenaria]
MSETKPKTGKGKLPPIDPNATADDADKPKKKVVKKKKKPVEETAAEGVEPPKRTPRKKKAASADSTAGEGAETTAPKKKKRVPKKTDKEGDPSSARSATSQGEDVNGSKASLIKSPKDGTPRKKKTKKKDKKAERGETEAGFDNTLTAELTDLQDDIIPHDAKRDEEEEEEYKKPYATGSHAVRSQPTEKFYIETDEAKEKAIVHEEPKNTTMEFALTTQKVIRTFSLFCHGLLAGLSVWHIVMAYVLLDFPLQDFILHYGKLALPVQFDVANPRGGFVLKALTLQNGTVSVVFYFAALLVSLSNAALEDKIHLYDQQLRNLTVNELWRNLNTSRNVLSVIGWFVISLTPLTDRLTDNLKHTDEDDLLGVEIKARTKFQWSFYVDNGYSGQLSWEET